MPSSSSNRWHDGMMGRFEAHIHARLLSVGASTESQSPCVIVGDTHTERHRETHRERGGGETNANTSHGPMRCDARCDAMYAVD